MFELDKHYLFLYIILLLFSVKKCKIINHKELPKFDRIEELSCGVHTSMIFADHPINTRYLDTQVILQLKEQLSLTNKQKTTLFTLARECFEICEVEKSQMQQSEIKLRHKIIEKSQKMGKNKILQLPQIARALREIYLDKTLWLKQHQKRYRNSVKVLSQKQKLILEKMLESYTNITKF